jgi:hypothetical protein
MACSHRHGSPKNLDGTLHCMCACTDCQHGSEQTIDCAGARPWNRRAVLPPAHMLMHAESQRDQFKTNLERFPLRASELNNLDEASGKKNQTVYYKFDKN